MHAGVRVVGIRMKHHKETVEHAAERVFSILSEDELRYEGK